MAQFRQYNIQLIPKDTRQAGDIGPKGYAKFIEKFQEYVHGVYRNKQILENAAPLVNESYIFPFHVITKDLNFSYGTFVKFHRAEIVTELYSSEPLFEAPPGKTAVTSKYEFRFVFNYESHIFAIEERNGRLPSAAKLLGALESFFSSAAAYFPEHVLKVCLISDKKTLREVLRTGNEYGPVHISLTFPNGKFLNSTLQNLRNSNAHTVDLKIAPERGIRMPEIPLFAKELLTSAIRYGKAKLIFYKKITAQADKSSVTKYEKKSYSSMENPQHLRLRQNIKEDDFSFLQRVWRTIIYNSKNGVYDFNDE